MDFYGDVLGNPEISLGIYLGVPHRISLEKSSEDLPKNSSIVLPKMFPRVSTVILSGISLHNLPAALPRYF